MNHNIPKTVLWEWTVRAHSFEGRVEAAAAGGFDILPLSYRNYRRELAAGRRGGDLAAIAADQGVTLDFLDGMTGWTPIRFPEGADAFLREAMDFGPQEALEMCSAAGLRHIVAIAGFLPGAFSQAELVDHFGRFCELAASAHVRVVLEAMPMLGLPRLSDSWNIVHEANCANSGLMVDTWHFMRGGADMELLKSIPHGTITDVQLADGPLAAEDDLWEEASHRRELPGAGELPIENILTVLRQTQDLRTVGPEALSDKLDNLSPIEVGTLSADATRAALAAAGYVA